MPRTLRYEIVRDFDFSQGRQDALLEMFTHLGENNSSVKIRDAYPVTSFALLMVGHRVGYWVTSPIRNSPPPLGPPYGPSHGPTVGS